MFVAPNPYFGLHTLKTVNEKNEPNKAMQPSRMLVTFRAYARPAPSTRLADL